MGDTKIEWAGKSWGIIRGCLRQSPGCDNCWAQRQAIRMVGGAYKGLVKMTTHGPRWTGKVRFVPEKLAEPLRWRKPQRVFVGSMSDLFHDGYSNEQIAAVFGIMAACQQHTFLVLTKRPHRALAWFKWANRDQMPGGVMHAGIGPHLCAALGIPDTPQPCEAFEKADAIAETIIGAEWPLPNVHFGVSVENGAAAQARLPLLQSIPAAVRWMSAEPLLEDLGNIHYWLSPTRGYPSGRAYKPPGLDWVVVGSEAGPSARPMNEDWVRSLRDQCVLADVPFFFKQRLDGGGRKVSMPELDGKVWGEFPR